MVTIDRAKAFAAAWAERIVVKKNQRIEVEKEPDRIPQFVVSLGLGLDEKKEEQEQEQTLHDPADVLNGEITHMPDLSLSLSIHG